MYKLFGFRFRLNPFSVSTGPIIRQGTPTATTPSGISFVTTLPAPITELEPMVTPGVTIHPPPSQTLSPITMGFANSSPDRRISGSTGCPAVRRLTFGPMSTSLPIVILAQSSMMQLKLAKKPSPISIWCPYSQRKGVSI